MLPGHWLARQSTSKSPKPWHWQRSMHAKNPRTRMNASTILVSGPDKNTAALRRPMKWTRSPRNSYLSVTFPLSNPRTRHPPPNKAKEKNKTPRADAHASMPAVRCPRACHALADKKDGPTVLQLVDADHRQQILADRRKAAKTGLTRRVIAATYDGRKSRRRKQWTIVSTFKTSDLYSKNN